MSVSRRLLCIVYALIAVLALIGTWGNNVAYLGGGLLETNRAFWSDTLVNPASRSITVDLFYLGLAVFVWMVLEARRLGMRWVWLYLVFGMLVAISVTVPVFLILRERALAKNDPGSLAGRLTVIDGIGLMIVTVAIVAYTVLALQT
jgi:hypothetical protein